MGISGSSITSWIIQAVLQWLLDGFTKLFQDMKRKAEDRQENADIRKGVENAQTDDAAQDALNKAGSHLGHP